MDPNGKNATHAAHGELSDPPEGIAIVGMAGRFPGAPSTGQLWTNLCAGVESVSFFSRDGIDPSIDPALLDDPHYVKARGIIDNAEYFDAAFFGITPREAEVMDPQHRILLELSWEAFEDAGHVPQTFVGPIGVFAGMGNNTYFPNNVSAHPSRIAVVGKFQTMLLNEKDFLTTRISYKLGLRGPSVNLYTACSTSLVAVCYAAESLLNHECDMALAGGISIVFPQKSGYLFEEGAILSPDGHCRPFDARAGGTVFGNGGGLVVLRRLEDAIRDHDDIRTVIKGWAVNNDGAGKASFMAPSVKGQSDAIVMAHYHAGIAPDSITYVETHGTATSIGDAIEINALNRAFSTGKRKGRYCAIGSIKSNIGHLDTAAGIAGLIKTALALEHRKLPPTLHFQTPNPEIDFDGGPFYVNDVLSEWKANEFPRRAGVSSFGIGGTNAHVVLEEYAAGSTEGKAARPLHLFPFSAPTQPALKALTALHREHLRTSAPANPGNIAFTLQEGRKAFLHRAYLVYGPSQDVAAAQSLKEPGPIAAKAAAENPPVAFMFPGQGAQYVGMGENFYKDEPLFRTIVDQCCEVLKPCIDIDLRTVLYPAEKDRLEAAEKLRMTSMTQPALFVIEYALARLWEHWGVVPESMIGHSIGEYVAACIANVFSFEDALRVVASRARMMQRMPPGAMLFVRLPEERLSGRIGRGLSIAAINAPELCVVSGEPEAIISFSKTLESEGVSCGALKTSHAFHSAMFDPVVGEFEAFLKTIKLSPPTVRFISSVTGTWIEEQKAISPAYWAGQLRSTVRFGDGVSRLLENKGRALLEVGPRTTCTTLAKQQRGAPFDNTIVASLADTPENHAEWETVLHAMGTLWMAGVVIDWKNFNKNRAVKKVPLPVYPFERKRFWLDAPVYGTPGKSGYSLAVSPGGAITDTRRLEKIIGLHPAVDRARIIVKGAVMVAYYSIKQDKSVTVTDLREFCAIEAPGAVLPRYFVETVEVPQLNDESAVQSAGPGQDTAQTEGELAPRTTGEKILARIWRETLGIERVNVIDSFIDRGGDSVLSLQVINLLAAETGVKLIPRVLLLNSLKQIAAQYFPEKTRDRVDDKEKITAPSPPSKAEVARGESFYPFHFGDFLTPLFGIYYPAARSSVRDAGVVLCGPIGQEYMRTHWAIRLLAGRLTRAGFPVMKFDYFGHGDSAGLPAECRVARWLRDIVSAAREMKAWSGLTDVSLVGLRFGASLAALAASEYLKVKNLVLWDPVIRGKDYLKALSALHDARFGGLKNTKKDSPRKELLGFPYAAGMWEDIERVDISSMHHENAGRVALVVSEENSEYSALQSIVSARVKNFDYHYQNDANAWNDPKQFDEALLVNKILDTIVNALSEGRP